MDSQKRIVISLGGSLIAPDDVDVTFLSAFRALILSYTARGFSFAIATGGGKTCRRYQAAGREIAGLSKEDVDWVGIHVNCMHAEFVRVLFKDVAEPHIVKEFSQPIPHNHPVVLIGAEKPGHSSDFDAVMTAKKFNAKKVINLSNIDYAYDKDPKIFKDAQKIEDITWSEFRKLLPVEWDPGLSSPFDPIAAKLAEELGITVTIVNGKAFSELEKCLNNEPFAGTIVHP
jgi:uridylate kinase